MIISMTVGNTRGFIAKKRRIEGAALIERTCELGIQGFAVISVIAENM